MKKIYRSFKSACKNEEGMTLVEVMASLILLLIILTSFTAFFINSARTTAQTERQTLARLKASEMVEELTYFAERGNDFEDLQAYLTNADRRNIWTSQTANGTRYSLTTPKEGFHAQLEVIPVEAREQSYEGYEVNEVYRFIVTIHDPQTFNREMAKLETRLLFGQEELEGEES